MKLQTQYQYGFTLIEIMLVVTIMGILASIAYPSYVNYLNRTHRADVMTELQQMNTRINSGKITYKKYTNIPLESIAPPGAAISSGKFVFPTSGNPLYDITIFNTANGKTKVTGTTLSTRKWQIVAKPISTSEMDGDGDLSIDSNGKKCWKNYCGMSDEWQRN